MRRIKSHTTEKLVYFGKYLNAYLKATKRLSKRVFIDAFAGTGECILCDENCNSRGREKCLKCGKGKLKKGSVLISLNTKDKFDNYIFIDLDKNNINYLKKLIKREEFINIFNRIEIIKDDCNNFLKDFYKKSEKYTGYLILLDPESCELNWETFESLSKIEKIDVLILYPYNMSLVRLIKNYKNKLNSYYGDPSWEEVYNKNRNISSQKSNRAMIEFFENRLKNTGFKHISSRLIRTKLRRGNPLYYFILASKKPIAKKIMDDIFDIELDGQKKLF